MPRLDGGEIARIGGAPQFNFAWRAFGDLPMGPPVGSRPAVGHHTFYACGPDFAVFDNEVVDDVERGIGHLERPGVVAGGPPPPGYQNPSSPPPPNPSA